MIQYLGEFLGTFILVLLGDGVVAGNVLSKTKEEGTGWVSIVLGWGIACTVAVYVSGFFSPAHLNPAVTFAMASIGAISWGQVFRSFLHKCWVPWLRLLFYGFTITLIGLKRKIQA